MSLTENTTVSIGLLVTFVAAVVAGVWWAATMNTRMDVLQEDLHEMQGRIEALRSQADVTGRKVDTLLTMIGRYTNATHPGLR